MQYTNQVSNVIDGDTFQTNSGNVIRLANVNAPETNEVGGAAATAELRRLIGGKSVLINQVAIGPYGRIIAEVSVDGISVNRAMNMFLQS